MIPKTRRLTSFFFELTGPPKAEKILLAKGYVFSLKEDLLVFFGPGLLVFCLDQLLSLWGLLQRPLGPTYFLAFSLFFNLPHLYSTFLRTYFHPVEREKHKSLLLWTPLLSLIFLFLVQAYSYQALIHMAAYFAIFHHIRQQYGWMMICSKPTKPSKWEIWFDQIMIYNLGVFPILRLHTLGPSPKWFDEGDMFPLPVQWAQWGHLLFWAITLGYIGSQIYWFLRKRQLPLGKYLIVLSTFCCWYMSTTFFTGPLAVFMLGLNHQVPYLYLIYKFNAQSSQKFGSGQILYKSWGPLLVFAALVLVSGLEELIWFQESWVEIHLGKFWDYFLIPALYLPQFMHYILDSFIWKKGQHRPF